MNNLLFILHIYVSILMLPFFLVLDFRTAPILLYYLYLIMYMYVCYRVRYQFFLFHTIFLL